MHAIRLAVIVCLLSTPACLFGAPLELYVSPQGEDAHPGTIEKPVKTLEAAVALIEKTKADGGIPAEGVTVTLQGGDYELKSPISIEGYGHNGEGPVIIQGAEDQTVRLLGSRIINQFSPVTQEEVGDQLSPEALKQVQVADLASIELDDMGTVAGAGTRLELFYRHEPMQLARWPNEGFTTIKEAVGETKIKPHGIAGTQEGLFTYEGDRAERWVNAPEVWLHGYWFWDWSDSFERVENIDPEQKRIQLAKPDHNYGFRNNQRYYALNILTELDQPGEWYLDRISKKLYFWPPGEIRTGDVQLSVLCSLIEIENSQNITLKNLTFEGTRSTMISLRNSEHCVVDHCQFLNGGSGGVNIGLGRECVVQHCHIRNMGEWGISITGGDRNTLTPAGHLALSNHIHHFGRLFRTYRPGIAVYGVGIRVAHNLIHDGPHNAIQLGGNDHLIEFNEVHNVCFETGDVGAFYMGRDWSARGTVIRHNFFHDISGPGLYGAMAVYLDDAASGISIIGNLFQRSGRSAFIGGGRDNLVENNIFVDCHPSVHVDSRGIGWMHETVATTLPERLKAMPYQESPWKERYPQLLTLLEDEPGKPKYNIVRKNISVGGVWSHIDEKAKPLVTEENNLIDQDPHFSGNPQSPSATAVDFKIKSDSPAFDLGFEQIPVEKIGLLEK
ncbi:MAG: right-handed parallel beta-helix repeat-containing protein [Planctomycetaceae bacterium]